MQYLVTTFDGAPFLTDYFDMENCFDHRECMVVYDLINFCYTKDGKTWLAIKADHL